MTTMDHFRSLTALGEHDLQDREQWCRLVNRVFTGDMRQEMMMSNQVTPKAQNMALSAHLLQSIPTQLQLYHKDCQLTPPSEMLPVEARQFLGTYLSPTLAPHPNIMSPIGYPGSGHNFPYSKPIAMVARQQEIIHKNNMARLEILQQQKDLERTHQKWLMSMGYPIMQQDQGIPFNPIPFWVSQHVPEVHPPNNIFIHHVPPGNQQDSNLLVSARPYPPIRTLQRERRRTAHRMGAGHKKMDCSAQEAMRRQPESKSQLEYMRVEACKEDSVGPEEQGGGAAEGVDHAGKGHRTPSWSGHMRRDLESERRISAHQDNCARVPDANNSLRVVPKHTRSTETYLCSSPFSLPENLPYKFPAPGNELLSLGSHGDEMVELRKWTVEDVYSFIKDIPGCSEYAEVFKDHAIDGETLPLLTDDHLLDTLGVKLGPALKIKTQVFQHLHIMFCVTDVPNAGAAAILYAGQGKAGSLSSEISTLLPSWDNTHTPGSLCSTDKASAKPSEQQNPVITNVS